MAKYSEKLQKIWHEYLKRSDGVPTGTRDVVGWAVESGLLAAPKIDPIGVLAEEMAKAIREEYAVDSSGRRYRVNHCARVSKDGVQLSLWSEMSRAPREFMVKAFAQRRKQIVGDCFQLKVDVDAYNGMNVKSAPIQMILDFTEDVAELQAEEAVEPAA